MQVVRAKALGMCFGVRDAIELASAQVETAPLTILGDLVHNAAVLADLREKGIATAHSPSDVATQTVMVTAHGTSEKTLAGVRARGLRIVEATCPLVHVAHRAVRALLRDGYHPIIIGQRGHVEVRGLTDDLDEFDVVLDESDVSQLVERPRLGIAAQTTQPIERVRRLVGLVRERFPRADVKFIDTVCLPTKQRQDAAVALARQSDVVIVVGGASSNNTRELVKTCARHCPRVHQVETASDLRAEWFLATDVVGVTAGTSTPDAVIDLVEKRIRSLADVGQADASPPAITPPHTNYG